MSSERLAKEGRFDYLLIESTGISEPVPVAQTFSFVDEESGVDLSKFSYIDTMVTVVDCFNFMKDFGSAERLEDRQLTNMEGDDRTIVNLLTDQIEFADVIILNKTDLVDVDTIGVIRAALKKLNPEANIITSEFGKVDLNQVVNTGRFNFERAQENAGWKRELTMDHHTPETEEYGISSFVYREHRPFNQKRLWEYLRDKYPQTIIRAKGLFWLKDKPDEAVNFSQAGGSSRIDKAGVWWASMPFGERIQYASFLENREFIESRWHPTYGDRLNEIVFIGQDMNKEEIIRDLNACLEEQDFWDEVRNKN